MNREQRRAAARRDGGGRGKAHKVALLGGTAILAAGGPVVTGAPVGADTFTVTNLDDSGAGSLRQAIADANANGVGLDDITFASGLTGTITLTTGQLQVASSVAIQGPGADVVTVSGGDASRVFYLYDNAALLDVSISGLTVADGRATNGAGLLNVDENLVLDQVTFTGNDATTDGGALRTDGFDHSVTITDSTFDGNTAIVDGGAIYIEDTGGPVTISGTTVSGNTATADGGGIFLYDPDTLVTITDSTISGNLAAGKGGGIYLYDTDAGGLTIQGSTISGNNAATGGGIYLYGADDPVAITDSTISGNSATAGAGGGIFAYNANSSTSIERVTIAGNAATTSGGGLVLDNGATDATLSGVILGDNTAPADADLAVTSPVVTSSFSLVESSSVVVVGTDNVLGQDPQLGPLQDNGGSTLTRLPAATSPAVDAGDPTFAPPPATDQRGAARVQGTIDIGSVERVAPPTNDTGTTDEDVVLDVAAPGVLGNDAGPPGLTAQLVTGPTNGVLTFNPDGSYTYTPNQDVNGSDSFTYQAFAGVEATGTATVTITIDPVNDAPVAVDDADTVTGGTSVTVPVRGNDTDVEGTPLTVVGITQGADGSVVIDAVSGDPIYTPDPGFNGVDSFTYTVSDGGLTDTATVTITVENAAPVAVDDPAAATAGSDVLIPVLGNDSDPDLDTLTIDAVSTPTRGTAVIEGDQVRYTPTGDAAGTDSFTYTITDGALTATATVTVTIAELPNQAPVADDDTATVTGGDSVVVPVRDNDLDPDGDPLTVVGVTDGTDGTVVVDPTSGDPEYTPDVGFNGVDTFTYTVSDGALTDTATVTVTVENAAPVAVDDVATVTAGESVTVAVRGNDSDPDGDPLTVSATTAGANGTVAVDAATGDPVYTPNAGFEGVDTFTYTVTDGALTDTATVTVTVENAGPVAVDDSAAVPAGDTVLVPVLANDSDPDGDTLTVTGVSNAARGAVVVEGDQVRYTPTGAAAGTDTFTYTVSDGVLSATATVTVDIAAAPGLLVADDSASVVAGQSVTIDVLANDGAGLTVVSAADGTRGRTTSTDTTVTYTPTGAEGGSDSFTYTVTDGVQTASATVSITIGVADVPDDVVPAPIPPGSVPPATDTPATDTPAADGLARTGSDSVVLAAFGAGLAAAGAALSLASRRGRRATR